FYKDYNVPTDRNAMKAMLKLYREDVPSKFHPDFFTSVIDKKFKGSIDRFVDDLFSRSVFANEEKLMAFLEKPSLKTLQNDPVHLTSISIDNVRQEVSENLSQYDSDLAEGRRLWVAALKEMTPEKTLYPDANSTMRLTYGTIENY